METPSCGLAAARYLVQMCFGESQLKVMHKTLSSNWGELNSLSAAVRLMKAHGVALTPEEEQHLAQLDEGSQISMLVNKMPTQSTDEFQHFFLKLQLLVNTAARLRQALEEGEEDGVCQALADAESTDIEEHLLRVAIVQAGTQVVTMKTQMQEFGREAGTKLSRLVRGQQDALAAQKRLAKSQETLALKCRTHANHAVPIATAFACRNERVLLHMAFIEWSREAREAVMMRKVEEDFNSRAEALENRMATWKESQFGNAKGVMMKQVQAENAILMLDIFRLWVKVYEDEKFMHEHGDKVAAMEQRIAACKASSAELSKSILQRMIQGTDTGLQEMCWQAWRHATALGAEDREQARAAQELQDRVARYNEAMRLKMKNMLTTMIGSSAGALMSMCFQAWHDIYIEVVRENELAAALEEKSTRLLDMTGRSKAASTCAMSRAAATIRDTELLRAFTAWHKEVKIERCSRDYSARINAKRQQLQGVQLMFRNFAQELEAGIGGHKESGIDMFDVSRPHRVTKVGSGRGERERVPSKALMKSEQTVSLPSLTDHQRPGSRGGLVPVIPMKQANGRSQYQQPRPAW